MQGLRFWHSPYPYRDFLLFSHKGDHLTPSLRRIGDESSRIDMMVAPLPPQGEVSSFVITRADGQSFTEPTVLLSGIAQEAGSLYFGQESVHSSGVGERLRESVGIFTLLHSTDEQVRVSQDILGCGILYYYSSNDFVAVSNRYHLLLLFLSWTGHRPRLDVTKVVATLFSNSTFFQQNVSSNMDIAEVRQLPFDHDLTVDRDGWRMAPRPGVQAALAGSDSHDFHELVAEGRLEVIQNVRSAFESSYFTKIVTDLSGGMDSRAVFAAILNIDTAREKTEIRTVDVPGSTDLQIAAGLVNLFGARFYTENGRPQHPQSVSDVMGAWRSYFMGTYHRFGAGPWSPKGEHRSELRFSGGCGEVYRTFWAKIYGKVLSGAESTRDLVVKLVTSCSPPALRSSAVCDRVVDLLSHELTRLPGSEPIDLIENHYLFFRNRYHFGMRGIETYYDSPMWFPLMSRSLLTASRTLPPMARDNGVILELTEHLHPLLVWIDYDSVTAVQNDLLSRIHLSDKRFKGCHVTLDGSSHEWERIQRENKETLQRLRWEMEPQFDRDWREIDEHLRREAGRALEELMTLLPSGHDDLWAMLHAEVQGYLENPRLVRQFFSKLCSLRDQAAIFA